MGKVRQSALWVPIQAQGVARKNWGGGGAHHRMEKWNVYPRFVGLALMHTISKKIWERQMPPCPSLATAMYKRTSHVEGRCSLGKWKTFPQRNCVCDYTIQLSAVNETAVVNYPSHPLGSNWGEPRVPASDSGISGCNQTQSHHSLLTDSPTCAEMRERNTPHVPHPSSLGKIEIALALSTQLPSFEAGMI